MRAGLQRAAVSRQLPALLLIVAVLVFALVAIALQFVRDDLDWLRATLSLYLHGPHAVWLRAAYCLLAVAIAGFAVMLYRQAQGRARRGLPSSR